MWPEVIVLAFIPAPEMPKVQDIPPSSDIKIPPLIILTTSFGLVKLVVVIPVESQVTDWSLAFSSLMALFAKLFYNVLTVIVPSVSTIFAARPYSPV